MHAGVLMLRYITSSVIYAHTNYINNNTVISLCGLTHFRGFVVLCWLFKDLVV